MPSLEQVQVVGKAGEACLGQQYGSTIRVNNTGQQYGSTIRVNNTGQQYGSTIRAVYISIRGNNLLPRLREAYGSVAAIYILYIRGNNLLPRLREGLLYFVNEVTNCYLVGVIYTHATRVYPPAND